jgi:hypothetical protein
MKPHKHAALMLQYAQDAAETDKPWERWQYRLNAANWTTFTRTDQFEDFGGIEYRRKPSVILINDIEVPEPMREKPEIGTSYWLPDILDTDERLSSSEMTWDDHVLDNSLLERGLCHLTSEAAELHAKAIISFTKKEAK